MSITIVLIVVIAGISIWAFRESDVKYKLLFHPYTIKRSNEWYRFVTSGFVHNDWLHLIFNMITFYLFGRIMEHQVLKSLYGETEGGVYFALLFLVGVVVSHVSTYIKYKDYSGYRSLGASGGVSAVVFASIMFYPTIRIWGIPGFILGPLYLIYTYFQGKRGADNINHEAHLYGAIFGILFSIVVEPAVLGHFVAQVNGFMQGR